MSLGETSEDNVNLRGATRDIVASVVGIDDQQTIVVPTDAAGKQMSLYWSVFTGSQ